MREHQLPRGNMTQILSKEIQQIHEGMRPKKNKPVQNQGYLNAQNFHPPDQDLYGNHDYLAHFSGKGRGRGLNVTQKIPHLKQFL